MAILYNIESAFCPFASWSSQFMDLTLTSSPLALAVIFASKGLGPYLRQHFLDKTFQGLYQVNAFDLALLIPYFIVLDNPGGVRRAPLLDGLSLLQAQKEQDHGTRGSFPVSMNCPASPYSCRSLTSNMWWTGCSMPCAGSNIRKTSSTSSCWTTRPTKPSRSPAFWWSATPRWDIRSHTSTATIAKATRPAHWQKD